LQTNYQDILQTIQTTDDIDSYLISQLKTAADEFSKESS
jgi:hypothetical protein